MVLFDVFTGTDRPALKHLNRHVRPHITDKWHDIGVELLDVEDESALNTIKVNNPGDGHKCTAEMLQLWLEKKPDASWNQLIQALKAPIIKLEDLASKIEALLEGTYSYTYIMLFHNLIPGIIAVLKLIIDIFHLKTRCYMCYKLRNFIHIYTIKSQKSSHEQ